MAAATPPPDSEAAPAPPGPSGDVWSYTHTWRLDSFSTLWTRGKKHFSDVFFVGGCPWRLSLYPKGNTAVKGSRDHVAIYLEAADCASAPVGWKRYVDFRIGVVTHTPADGAADKSVWRSGAHEFNSETSDGTWGFSQFITVASLQNTAGLVVDDTLVVHGEVTLRWKRTSIDSALHLPSAAPPLPTTTDVTPDAAAQPQPPADADGATQPAGQLALPSLSDTATGLELPPALEAAYTRLVGCPSRVGGSLGGVLARAMAAQPPAGAAPSVLAVPEETATWHRALSGLRCATTLSGAVSHPSWSGAWAVPLWRTLQQVHSGASMHWQTLALAEGFITDVLVRLARAAHDVSAGTAAQPLALGAAPGAKDTAAGAGAGAGGDDSGGDSDDGGDSDSSSEDEAAAVTPAVPPPAAAAAAATAVAPASQAAAGASRLDTAELALYEKIGGPPPAHSAAAEQQSGGAGGGAAGAQPPISVVDVVAALSRVLPKELATHAALESRDALEAAAGLWRGPGPPPRPVVFDPDRCWAAAQALVQVPGSGTSMPALVPRGATSGARLYVAAVLEYMAAELLELSVDQALATGGAAPGGAAKRAASEAGPSPSSTAEGGPASSPGAPAAGTVAKAGAAAPFLLPCHCVQALRHDEELGMRTAALAAVPLAGVTYVSLLGLFAPPQPAAKKALQKKKADAALDSAWQKELRRKQREAEKARKEREEKLKKEREKEKRRAEREAARKLDQERRARQQNSALEQAAELARQRLKERLAAVVDQSGCTLGVAPPPADLRWPTRSFLCTGRCRADGCTDRDVFPDIPEGGVELTCSSRCSILYHGGFCWAGVSRALLEQQQQRFAAGGAAAPPSPGVGVGDDTVSEDGTGTAPPSEAGGDAAAHTLLPRDMACPTPGCSGVIVAAIRLDKAGRIDILAPLPPPAGAAGAAAGDDESSTPGGTPGESSAEVKKKKKRGSGATKLAAAEAAKAAAEAAKAAAEAAKAAAAQAAAQARAAAAAAAAERAAAEKAAADKAAATRAAAQAAQKSSAATKTVPQPQAVQQTPAHPPVAEKSAAEPSVAAATDAAAAPAAAPSSPSNGKAPPAAPAASAAKPGGAREVPDTWEDSVGGDDEAQQRSQAAAAAAPTSSAKAASAPAAAPPAKKGMSSAFGAITETLAALGLRSGGGADTKTKAAAAAAAAAVAAAQKATAKEPPAVVNTPAGGSTVPPAKCAAPAASAPTSSPKAKDAAPAPFADTSRGAGGKAAQSAEQAGVPASQPNGSDPKPNGGGHSRSSSLADPLPPLGGALNALRHARRGVVTGVPQGMLLPGEHQPWVRDGLNAALAAHDTTTDMPCVAVTAVTTTGTLMVDFATLQAAEAALGAAAERQLLVGGAPVRLQRLRAPPPGVPALDLRPPHSSVTGRIDALIQSGQLQPAHISDRMWELLHVLDARTVLTALAEWPPSNGALAAQDGAVALAALCQQKAGVGLLDLVALPGPATPALQQAQYAAEPQAESAASGYWAAPQAQSTGWGCDPPGLHYVSAALHGRWLMCNAALRDRWNARRVCLGCGARLLQPHRQHCPLPGVAPPPGLPPTHFHTQPQRGIAAMQQPVAGLGAALLSQLNGEGAHHTQQHAQQQLRQAAPPGMPGLPRVPSGSTPQAMAWGPGSGQGGRGGGGAPMGMSPPQGGPTPLPWHTSAGHHSSGEPPGSSQWAPQGGMGQQPPLPSGPPPPRTASGSVHPQHLQPSGPPAGAAQLPGRQMPRVPSGSAVVAPASAGLGRGAAPPPPGASAYQQQPPPRQLPASSSSQHFGDIGGARDGPEEEVCPICCETVDDTDKAFFPCPCGFQPCMFCYNKIVEIGDARCPACRRGYGAGQNGEGDGSSSSSSSEDDSDSESDADTGPAAASKPAAAAGASRTGRQDVRMASRGA